MPMLQGCSAKLETENACLKIGIFIDSVHLNVRRKEPLFNKTNVPETKRAPFKVLCFRCVASCVEHKYKTGFTHVAVCFPKWEEERLSSLL